MYNLEWVPSPNFTPASQSKSVYGKPRTIDFGAGHWWGDPNAGYSHQGVVNTFLNPNRQASAHAVISAGRVTEMVRQGDIAWATNNANPFTFAIELKPNMTDADKYTCAEYIADKGFHNLQFHPHNHWKATQCNPLPWGEIMDLAKKIRAEKDAPKPPIPVEWKVNLKPLTFHTLWAIDDSTPLRNLNSPAQVIKNFGAGTPFEIAAETWVGGHRYLITRYALENNTGQGFDEYELRAAEVPVPEVPEWQKNLVDIIPTKLMAMWPDVAIYNMNTMDVIGTIPKGTWVDFTKKTKVGEREYLVSSYSATNALPNGILASRMGMPVDPPVNEKPEWLQNWQEIEDKDMYARGAAPVVDLLTGDTVRVMEPNTLVRVISATFWHGQQYFLISQEGTPPHGVPVVSLDVVPSNNPDVPAQPAPQQPPVVAMTWYWRLLIFIINLFNRNK